MTTTPTARDLETRRFNSKACQWCKNAGRPRVVTSMLATRVEFRQRDPKFGYFAFRDEKGELHRQSRVTMGPRTKCRECDQTISLRPVLGKVNLKKDCDGRCMGARGFSCECSCGGRNHGAAYG